VLIVQSPTICCSVQSLFKQPKPGSVSQLPAGFAVLELHAPCISMTSSGLQEFVTDAAAAWHLCKFSYLCKFFARAPLSYQRFSFRCTEDGPMRIQLADDPGAIDPVSGRCRRPRRLPYDSSKTLAKFMQHCVNVCSLSVNVIAESRKHLHVVRR